MSYLPLCESAKKGHVCPDDLCHGADVTLCGFDKNEYYRMTEDYREGCPWCGERTECQPTCRSRFDDGVDDDEC